jgi:hypothetical protein
MLATELLLSMLSTTIPKNPGGHRFQPGMYKAIEVSVSWQPEWVHLFALTELLALSYGV